MIKLLLAYSAILSVPVAWITHIWVTIAAKAWGLMAVGLLLPPVGILHGYLTWFGFDWIN